MYLRHTVLNRTKRSFYYQLTAYSRHSSNKLRNVLRRTSLKVFMFHNDFPVQPCVCWSRRSYKEELNIVWLAVWIRPSLANTRTEQERLICRDNSKCKNLERSELPLLSHGGTQNATFWCMLIIQTLFVWQIVLARPDSASNTFVIGSFILLQARVLACSERPICSDNRS